MLHYENVIESDIPAMTSLFRHFLNDGAGVEEYLQKGFEMPGYIGVTCKDDDRLVAVITAVPGIEFTYPKPEIEKMIKEGWPGRKIYTGEMLAVLPEYRGRGISREIYTRWVKQMRAAGAEYLMLELWKKRDGDVPASGTVKYAGTVEASWTFPDFYKDLAKYGMTCADCEPGPCVCGAVVEMIRL